MTFDLKEALAEMQGGIEDQVSGIKQDLVKNDEEIGKALKTTFEMAKANGEAVQEMRTKQTEYTEKLEGLTDQVTKGFEAQGENTKQLQALNDTLTNLKKDGNFLAVVNGDEAPDAELKKNATEFYARKHYFIHGTDKGAAKFDAKAVNEDKVAEYAHAKSAIYKMFRSDAAQNGNVALTPEERKAISTVSHDDQYFLPTEVSNQVIRCFTEETTMVGMFDNVRMGGHRLMFPVEPAEGVYAEWSCEIDCDKEDTELQQWGSIELVVKDLMAKACITGTMARDSAIDIESRLGAIARRSFDTKITRDYFSANPAGGMEGAFTAGNHVCVETKEAGKLAYLDLVRLAASYPTQFANGARWVLNCNTAGYIYTMTNAMGIPFFNMNDANILGFPVTKVDQMPGLSVDGEALTPGVKAIALVNPNEHYVLARREDFRASRNPYRKQHCNLIEWYFHISLAGAVKCPNAFRAMKVKEA